MIEDVAEFVDPLQKQPGHELSAKDADFRPPAQATWAMGIRISSRFCQAVKSRSHGSRTTD